MFVDLKDAVHSQSVAYFSGRYLGNYFSFSLINEIEH